MYGSKRVLVRDLNPHILCALCGGYLIQATTVIECLHSFCRTCIVNFLETSKVCPICDAQIHKTRPLLNIRPDQTLQSLVYKLVPGLFQDEMKRRREFHATLSESDVEDLTLEERGEAKLEREYRKGDDHVSLSLQMAYREDNRKAFTVKDTRHLLCPSEVTIRHLKKFLRAKFSLSEDYKIEMFQEGEELTDELMLQDVALIYAWRGDKPMCICYTLTEQKKKCHSRRSKIIKHKSVTPQDNKAASNTETAEVLLKNNPESASLSSSTLTSPSTALRPSTSLASPSTSLTSPSTSLTSPSTSLTSPSTSLTSPSTSLTSPSTSLTSPSTSLTPSVTITLCDALSPASVSSFPSVSSSSVSQSDKMDIMSSVSESALPPSQGVTTSLPRVSLNYKNESSCLIKYDDNNHNTPATDTRQPIADKGQPTTKPAVTLLHSVQSILSKEKKKIHQKADVPLSWKPVQELNKTVYSEPPLQSDQIGASGAQVNTVTKEKTLKQSVETHLQAPDSDKRQLADCSQSRFTCEKTEVIDELNMKFEQPDKSKSYSKVSTKHKDDSSPTKAEKSSNEADIKFSAKFSLDYSNMSADSKNSLKIKFTKDCRANEHRPTLTNGSSSGSRKQDSFFNQTTSPLGESIKIKKEVSREHEKNELSKGEFPHSESKIFSVPPGDSSCTPYIPNSQKLEKVSLVKRSLSYESHKSSVEPGFKLVGGGDSMEKRNWKKRKLSAMDLDSPNGDSCTSVFSEIGQTGPNHHTTKSSFVQEHCVSHFLMSGAHDVPSSKLAHCQRLVSGSDSNLRGTDALTKPLHALPSSHMTPSSYKSHSLCSKSTKQRKKSGENTEENTGLSRDLSGVKSLEEISVEISSSPSDVSSVTSPVTDVTSPGTEDRTDSSVLPDLGGSCCVSNYQSRGVPLDLSSKRKK